MKNDLTLPEFAEAMPRVFMVGGMSRWNEGSAELLAGCGPVAARGVDHTVDGR